MAIASEIAVMVSASTDKAEGALKGLGGTISGLGGMAAKAGLAVGGGLLVAGVGAAAAALKIGGEFDGAYDSIAATTGKSGAALDDLKASFKNVVSGVPADFGEASGAIATLNQKLGLSGKPLEDLSKQMLNLSRTTGTDVTANVDAAAGALAAAAVALAFEKIRIIWWSDAQAIKQKVNLARKLGVRGVAIFKLDGSADPQTWSVLK